MIIYEVNLSVELGVLKEFNIWLEKHVSEMLQFPGFIDANILREEMDDNTNDRESLTIHYQLENRAYLQQYFDNFSVNMREEGIKLFDNKFSANRRIFEVQNHILK